MNWKPLGRGLSALISTAPTPQDNEELRELEIYLRRPGEQQPGTTFDEARLYSNENGLVAVPTRLWAGAVVEANHFPKVIEKFKKTDSVPEIPFFSPELELLTENLANSVRG